MRAPALAILAACLSAADPMGDERLATSFLPTVVPGAVGGAVAWYESDAPEPWRHRLAWLDQRPRPFLDGRAGTIALWFRHDAPTVFYEALVAVRGDGDGVARPGDGDRQGLSLSIAPPDSTGWSDGDPAHFRRGRVQAEFVGSDGRGVGLAGPDLVPGTWTHVAMTWDASHVALHVDGRQVDRRDQPSLPDLDAVERFWLGVNQLGACSFAGAIDQVMAWDRPLDAAELAALAARVAPSDDGHLVLDLPFDHGGQARVRRRPARHPAQMRPAVSLAGGRPVVVAGEPLAVAVAVPPGSGTWQVRAAIAPLGGAPAGPGEAVAVTAPGDRPGEVVLRFATATCGVQRVGVTCVGADGHEERASIDAAVTVPPPPARPGSLLGDHLEMREWGGLGTGWTRIWQYEAGWHRCEPRPGVFFWDHLDRLVAEAASGGRQVLLCVHFTPAWASTAPAVEAVEAVEVELRAHGMSAARAAREAPGHRCLYPPRDPADWERYLAALFARYRGRIAAYELLNEPNSPEWHGDAAGYAAQLRAMHRVARTVDPAAVVVGGAGCPGYREWTRRIVDAGAAPWLDVLSVHDYQYDPPLRWLGQGLIPGVRATVGRGAAVPVWDSESAFPTAPRIGGLPMGEGEFARRFGDSARAGGVVMMTEAQGARREVMARLVTLAGGAARTFIHACSGLQDNRYRQPPTAKQVAWTQLAASLDGADRVEALARVGDGMLAIAVQAGTRRTLALLADRDGVLPLAWPDGVAVQASDVFGNRVVLAARDGVLAAPVGDSVLWLADAPASAVPQRVLDLSPAAPFEAGRTLRLEARVRNPTRRELVVELRATCPGAGVRSEPAALRLAPGAEGVAAVLVDPGAHPRRGDRRLTVEAVVDGAVWGAGERELWCPGEELALPRLAAIPAPGADAAAWRAGGAMEAAIDGRGEQVAKGRPNPMFPDRGPCWRGADDCSAVMLAGWTPEGLHLRLAVRDDAVVPPPDGAEGRAWGWDAAEVFLDLRPAEVRLAALRRRGPGTVQVFVCAPAGDGWSPARIAAPPGTVVVTGRARQVAGGWEAELRLAPSAGQPLAAGAALGLDVAIDDADRPGDQAMRVTQLVWQGGAEDYRDPGLWGSCRLTAP